MTIRLVGSTVSTCSPLILFTGVEACRNPKQWSILNFLQCVVCSVELAFHKHQRCIIELRLGALLLSDEICSGRPTIHNSSLQWSILNFHNVQFVPSRLPFTSIGGDIELLGVALLLSDEICSARPTIHKSLNGCLIISSNLFLQSHLCPIQQIEI